MNRLALQTFGFQSLPDENALRRRYRDLLFENHPDRQPGDRANRQTGQIIQAYRSLCRDIRARASGERLLPEPGGCDRQTGFQLLRGSFGNVAVPLRSVDGFVRAKDTVIENRHFMAVARHGEASYTLFSPGGKRVSFRASIHWLLLLRTDEKGALAFRSIPEINYFIPERELPALREDGGVRSIFVGGLSYLVPGVPGIVL